MKVGDNHQVEPNIHAGVKYMDHLMTKYFKDAPYKLILDAQGEAEKARHQMKSTGS
jgi:hypothetical protein